MLRRAAAALSLVAVSYIVPWRSFSVSSACRMASVAHSIHNPFLPTTLYTSAQVRDNEDKAAASMGASMFELMERAGATTFNLIKSPGLLQLTKPLSHILVVAGKGNNGGDGYIVARLAQKQGVRVDLFQIGDAQELKGDAGKARDQWVKEGGTIQALTDEFKVTASVDVVIDGIFGTGLSRAIQPGLFVHAIEQINRSGKPVVAIDIPSGLHGDTGQVMGVAVRATHTVTFVGLKQGLFTGKAADHVGKLFYGGLGIETSFSKLVPSTVSRANYKSLQQHLGLRPACSHKGNFGKIVLAGGGEGMPGAMRMASEAALRTGAGLVKTITHVSSASAVLSGRPEVMAAPWDGASDTLAATLDWGTHFVVGPGLGTSDWSRELFAHVSRLDKPMVLDADGLNLLSQQSDGLRSDNWVLTPHPAEASRLLGISIAEVEQDRFSAAQRIQAKYGGVVLLKGTGTIVTNGSKTLVLNVGNPGMSSGGMGDVLSGIIGGLLAQGVPLLDAAALGGVIHGDAADLAVEEDGERGLLATDLLPFVRKLVNPIRRLPKQQWDA